MNGYNTIIYCSTIKLAVVSLDYSLEIGYENFVCGLNSNIRIIVLVVLGDVRAYKLPGPLI